jgi:hypothetical protein
MTGRKKSGAITEAMIRTFEWDQGPARRSLNFVLITAITFIEYLKLGTVFIQASI